MDHLQHFLRVWQMFQYVDQKHSIKSSELADQIFSQRLFNYGNAPCARSFCVLMPRFDSNSSPPPLHERVEKLARAASDIQNPTVFWRQSANNLCPPFRVMRDTGVLLDVSIKRPDFLIRRPGHDLKKAVLFIANEATTVGHLQFLPSAIHA
jgi:hypothetical protein